MPFPVFRSHCVGLRQKKISFCAAGRLYSGSGGKSKLWSKRHDRHIILHYNRNLIILYDRHPVKHIARQIHLRYVAFGIQRLRLNARHAGQQHQHYRHYVVNLHILLHFIDYSHLLIACIHAAYTCADCKINHF
jgi:hypothetical protein